MRRDLALSHFAEHTATKALAWMLTVTVPAAYIVWPDVAEASHLGSSTASAGNSFLPVQQTIQAFQPDVFTGRAATAVPIIVPPGRQGMQPSLALQYASANRNGWLGVGWDLTLGYVERSTKNGPPRYGSADTFVFNFQGVQAELVQIPDGSYRAKDEGLFLKFTFNGTSWEVHDKSGTQYLFGASPNAELRTPNGTFRWCLEKVADTNGNYLEVSYTADQGMLYPAEIHYTGHEPTGELPPHRVVLTLEDRPDVESNYRSGSAIIIAKRVKEIATYAQTSQLARKYVLAYTLSSRTQRSLLVSVTQVGSDGVTTQPPMTFAYQATTAPTYTVSSNAATATSTAAWNYRARDNTGSSCVAPYSGSWYTASGSAGSDGSTSQTVGRAEVAHAWTYVYNATPRTVSLTTQGSAFCVIEPSDYSGACWFEAESSACLYIEDAQGVRYLGSNGTISAPLSAGWSIIHLTGQNPYGRDAETRPDTFTTSLSSPLKSQVDLMSASQFSTPQLTGDVDGNATSDLITFDANAKTWTVACATTCTVGPSGTWLTGFGTASSTPLVGDWDADGRTDIATYDSGAWRFAKSTGASFQADAWPQLTLGSGTPLVGDFNGDGRMDLGTFASGSWQVALSLGSRFTATGSFSVSLGSSSAQPLTGDFNGDGLTDIAAIESGTVSVALSNGTSFVVQPTAWLSGVAGEDTTSADLTGDGRTDLVRYDKTTGQVVVAPSTGMAFGSPTTLPLTLSLRAADDRLQVADLNGDGLSDPAVFNPVTGASELTRSEGVLPDLLRQHANGVGGTTTLTYAPSSAFDNTGEEDELPDLPFVIPVVTRVDLSDGLGHTYTTTYTYASGRYDAPTKEFRGFATMEARDATGTLTTTQFHQDEHKKGRLLRTEVRDATGNLWTKQEHTWSCTDPFPGVHVATLDATDAFTYDGDATFKQTRTRWTYDGFGNTIETISEGDASVSGDERTTETDYALDEVAWLLNRPSATRTRDATGTLVAQRHFTYDATGNLTQEEEWLSTPTEQWLVTMMTFDAYGNVATVTDALSRTTTNTYDAATHAYLTQIANALGHTRTLEYDVRLGVVISSTDPNGQTTRTVYDALGRVSKVIGPTDTDVLPTVSYEYDLSTTPTKTVMRTRVNSGDAATLDVYTFADGLGRTLQTRSPAEQSGKQVVTGDVEFDSRGLVVKAYLPSLADTATSLQPPTTSFTSVTYGYDTVGRLTSVTDPDATTSTTQYDDWTVTATDAKGHQKRQAHDTYGRLVTVEEFNDGQTYTTTYAYDALDQLTSVTDHGGNVTRMTYDSLGRKIVMDDPDMGRWTYAYDPVDNLTSQTDARGVTTSFTYDALNRLAQKSYTIPPDSELSTLNPVIYAYDDPAKAFSKGKLCAITDGSGSSSFAYDQLGRLITESKTIDGTTYAVARSYDLLGRLTTLTYPDGELATYTYNPQGGIETIATQSSVLSPPSSVLSSADYNAAGQLTKLVYGNGVISDYTYNPQTLRLDRLLTTGPGGTLQDLTYGFDAVGNVTQITDAIHTGTQSFLYDDVDRLTQASGSYGVDSYAYDALGNLTAKGTKMMTHGLPDRTKPHAVTALSDGTTFQYDANGNMTGRFKPTGLPEATYTFDAENRLTQVVTGETPAQTVTVTLQPGWNFFSMPVVPDHLAVTSVFPTFADDLEQVVRYEPEDGSFAQFVTTDPALSRWNDFTELEYGRGYEVYCTNPAGLTVTITGRPPAAAVSSALATGWHLMGSTATSGTQRLQDLLGNLVAGLDYDAVQRYDVRSGSLTTVPVATTDVSLGEAVYLHCLRQVTWTPPVPPAATSRTTFVYDGDGGRVKQTTPTGTTVYLGSLYEVSGAAVTKHVFAGSLRITSTVQDAERSTLNFYHGDHLGSSNVVTDGSGALVSVTEYTPYGELAASRQLPATSFGFTGQRFDTSTGLYFYHARYYDPTLGRFVSPNPRVQEPSDPQTLNRYAYVRNNPVRYVDPSGYDFGLSFFITLLVVAWLASDAWGSDEPNLPPPPPPRTCSGSHTPPAGAAGGEFPTIAAVGVSRSGRSPTRAIVGT